MSAPYTKNHIVPQSYLTRFAETSKNSHYIGMALKSSGKLIPAQVHDVGFKKNLYSSYTKADEKYWEKYLCVNFDSLCGDPLKSIIDTIESADGFYPALDDNNKTILSRILLSQAIRAFHSIRTTIAMKRRLLEYASSLSESVTVASLDDQALKEEYLDGLFKERDFNSRCEIIRTRVWRIFVNEHYTKLPFITSDNPVLMFNAATNKTGLLENIGIDDNTIIYFPITPKLMVENYSAFLNDCFPKLSLEYIYDGRCFKIADESCIGSLNRMLWENADKQVYIPEPLFREMRTNPDIIEQLRSKQKTARNHSL